jgi:hypothetical protein
MIQTVTSRAVHGSEMLHWAVGVARVWRETTRHCNASFPTQPDTGVGGVHKHCRAAKRNFGRNIGILEGT